MFDIKRNEYNFKHNYSIDYTLTNKTNNIYDIQYVYIHIDSSIFISGNMIDDEERISISKNEILETLEINMEDVIIWGSFLIKGFDYKKR